MNISGHALRHHLLEQSFQCSPPCCLTESSIMFVRTSSSNALAIPIPDTRCRLHSGSLPIVRCRCLHCHLITSHRPQNPRRWQSGDSIESDAVRAADIHYSPSTLTARRSPLTVRLWSALHGCSSSACPIGHIETQSPPNEVDRYAPRSSVTSPPCQRTKIQSRIAS